MSGTNFLSNAFFKVDRSLRIAAWYLLPFLTEDLRKYQTATRKLSTVHLFCNDFHLKRLSVAKTFETGATITRNLSIGSFEVLSCSSANGKCLENNFAKRAYDIRFNQNSVAQLLL